MKKILKIIGKTVDNILLGGLVQNITNKEYTPILNEKGELLGNKLKSNHGQIDWEKFLLDLLTRTVPILLLISLIMGWLTKEDILFFIENVDY